MKLARRRLFYAVAALAVFAGASHALAQDALRLGTSSQGSVFFQLAVGASELAREHAGLNVTVEPVGGSAANVNGIGAGNVDLAIANSFASVTGYNATAAFAGRDPIDLRLVAQGQASFRYMFLRTGSGIETPKDLEGKTVVGERRPLPELQLLMNAFIEHFDLDADSIDVVSTTNSGETIDAIRAGSVDAIIMPFSARAAQINEPMTDGVMTMLEISEADRDAILDLLPPNFFGVTLEPGTFNNQPNPIHLFALNTYMIASPDLADDVIANMTRALLDNTDQLATFHPAGRLWTAERALQNPAIPFHPGAIAYFMEKGLWTPELDALQADLLAR